MLASRLNLYLAVSILITGAGAPSWAISNAEVINAVSASGVLDQGIGVNARVDDDKVTVSTYRNPKDNEKDCKIDAVMLTKAISEASKDAVSRVTVCFFGKDLSQYQEVSVTAGDLKAFSSGQTGKDQLLSSLEVRKVTVANSADKVVNQLESAVTSRPTYSVVMKGVSQLVISTPIGPWVTDEECKLEALKIASLASTSMPDGVKQITVAFFDPRSIGETHELTFNAQNLPEAWRTVQTALNVFPLIKQAPAIDVQSLQVKDGPLKDERAQLLSRLKDLDKKGVGLAPFVQAFNQMEQTVAAGDEATVKSAVDHLSNSLDDQEKAYKAAKEDRPKLDTAQSPGPKAPIANVKGLSGGRWGPLGTEPIIAQDVLADPNRYIQQHERTLGVGSPKFIALLDAVAQILRNNGRAQAAVAFEQRAVALRAGHR